MPIPTRLLVVVLFAIVAAHCHSMNEASSALAKGNQKTQQLAAQTENGAQKNTNANKLNDAVSLASLRKKNAGSDRHLAEKSNALTNKENLERDQTSDILATENAGLYRKKRTSIFKKDVLDEKRAWRHADQMKSARERDRINRDESNASADKEIRDRQSKSGIQGISSAGANENAGSNENAGVRGADSSAY